MTYLFLGLAGQLFMIFIVLAVFAVMIGFFAVVWILIYRSFKNGVLGEFWNNRK